MAKAEKVKAAEAAAAELAAAQAARDANKRQLSNSSDLKIAAVRRGNCSFETKVKVAAVSGFAAIVVINNDNIAFPAGNYQSTTSQLIFQNAVSIS